MSDTKIKHPKIKFTGERLIPELNAGQTFYYEHLARYFFASQVVKNKSVLDAGCGVGYGPLILSQHGKANKVLGVDISKESIAYAKLKYKTNNIQYKIGDIRKLNSLVSEKQDIIVSFELIEHIKEQSQFLNEVKKTLKPDGIFIVSTPNKLTYPNGNKFHLKELFPNEFKNLLGKYFKKVKFYHQFFRFSQQIQTEVNENVNLKLETQYSFSKQYSFTEKTNFDHSQYIIAVCSNKSIPNITPVSINISNVDNFKMESGIISLTEQFNEVFSKVKTLEKEIKKKDYALSKRDKIIEEKNKEINGLYKVLSEIKSAKTFKIWQWFAERKRRVLSRFHP